MLNAFRHQRSNHLRAGGAGINPAQVLNAFRHQRSNHLLPRNLIPPSTPIVLNAFRHQRSNHPGAGQGHTARYLVLNAFRHQRSNHAQVRARNFQVKRCSTPFGIKDRITPGLPGEGGRQKTMCSTPFGIKDRITRAGGAGINPAQVLNAFRHQRSNHLPKAGFEPALYIVLNAFRHQRSNHPPYYNR